MDRVEDLIRRGAYAEAAAELRQGGDLLRAQELYERIWDFRSAAAVARERGDRLALLRLLIEAGEPHETRLLLGEILVAPPAEKQRAADLLERRRLWADAAQLRESLGDLQGARGLFQQAQLPLEVARISELLGDHRDAGRAYEQVLLREERTASGQEDRDAAARSDRLRAHLGLSRVLRRFGKHEDAVRQLQRARRLVADIGAYGSLLSDIDRQLIVGLCALHYAGAAQQVLLRLHSRSKDFGRVPPPTLESFLRTHRDLLQPQETDKGPAPEQAETLLLSRYAIAHLLGSGGMGRVYLAHDLLRDRQVAIKLVPPPPGYLRPLGQGRDQRDPAVLDSYGRFLREARVVQALRHPGIVQVLDFHEAEGLLVMEYMAGGTLAERPHPLPAPLSRSILLQLIDGLLLAHASGVIHRDIKPQNIFFTLTLDAKLGDFGVAHLQDLHTTQTAGFIGTLAYMAPEQISGAPLTFATDVYALGVTAFQMATGRLPFTGPDFVAQHLGEPPPRPTEIAPGLPAAWDALCLRSMAKEPRDRFASLDELRLAVLALPRDEPSAAAARHSAPLAVPAGAPGQVTESQPISALALLSRTDHSTLLLGTDTRLGRQVIVERFAPGLLQGEAGARHLRWLRAMARQGGPGLQRVLRIELDPGPEAQAVYEAPVGPLVHGDGAEGNRSLPPRKWAVLRRVLRRLHGEGEVHGQVAGSVVEEEALAVLLVSGRGPLCWAPLSPSGREPTPADDLRALSSLSGGRPIREGEEPQDELRQETQD